MEPPLGEQDKAVAFYPVITSSTPPRPSFEGRLKLREFIHQTSSLTRNLASSPRPTSIVDSHVFNPKRSPASRRNISRIKSPPASTRKRESSAADTNISSPPSKRKRASSSYAPPSTYAHLPFLPDAIGPNLYVLFVGLNPGIQTARTGHAYAHPTNLFWRLLHSSGVTPRLCTAAEDREMPRQYGLGLTNIVARPSRNEAELSKTEMDAGVATLEAKARRWRPEVVCIVGKSIWESVWRVRHGKGIKKDEFRYGWQRAEEKMGKPTERDVEEEREGNVDYKDEWNGATVFVATSTSGLAASLKPAEKLAVWRELGIWVEKRRVEKEGGKGGGKRG